MTLGFSKILDVRLGAEYDFNERLGVKADMGYSLISNPPKEMYFSWDLLGLITLTQEEQLLISRFLFGCIDGALLTTKPVVVAFSPSFSLFTGIRIGRIFDIGLRTGLGVWIQFEDDEVNTDFPWPDLTLEAHFAVSR